MQIPLRENDNPKTQILIKITPYALFSLLVFSGVTAVQITFRGRAHPFTKSLIKVTQKSKTFSFSLFSGVIAVQIPLEKASTDKRKLWSRLL